MNENLNLTEYYPKIKTINISQKTLIKNRK